MTPSDSQRDAAEELVRNETSYHHVGHESGGEEPECAILKNKPCDCPWQPYEDALISKIALFIAFCEQKAARAGADSVMLEEKTIDGHLHWEQTAERRGWNEAVLAMKAKREKLK